MSPKKIYHKKDSQGWHLFEFVLYLALLLPFSVVLLGFVGRIQRDQLLRDTVDRWVYEVRQAPLRWQLEGGAVLQARDLRVELNELTSQIENELKQQLQGPGLELFVQAGWVLIGIDADHGRHHGIREIWLSRGGVPDFVPRATAQHHDLVRALRLEARRTTSAGQSFWAVPAHCDNQENLPACRFLTESVLVGVQVFFKEGQAAQGLWEFLGVGHVYGEVKVVPVRHDVLL